jgi:tripartite-type tricarboxylate transporter receptor subunit TctC
MKTLASVALVLLSQAVAQQPAHAFPTKPVRLIVPVAAGGAADFAARHMASKLAEAWGQPVIVDNRPGGAGNLGVELAVRATPDGHTIVLPITSLPINPSLYSKLPFDTERDLAPIVLVGSGALLLVVHPGLPAKTVEGLIALAKAKPDALNYANSGSGTTAHLASELFRRMAGINITGVAYKGGGPSIVSLMSGQVQMYFSTIPAAIGQVKAGRLRALAVTSPQRVAELPELPTVSESGLPGFEVVWWIGLFAPAATPRSAITTVNTEANRVLKLADTRERFAAQGMLAAGSSPEALGGFLKSEIAKWRRVVKESGIRVE